MKSSIMQLLFLLIKQNKNPPTTQKLQQRCHTYKVTDTEIIITSQEQEPGVVIDSSPQNISSVITTGQETYRTNTVMQRQEMLRENTKQLMMLNVCIMYKNTVRMHVCLYLENLWCPPHLKKDMVELGKIPRKAAGMIKDMTQLLQKEQLKQIRALQTAKGVVGEQYLRDLYLTQEGYNDVMTLLKRTDPNIRKFPFSTHSQNNLRSLSQHGPHCCGRTYYPFMSAHTVINPSIDSDHRNMDFSRAICIARARL